MTAFTWWSKNRDAGMSNFIKLDIAVDQVTKLRSALCYNGRLLTRSITFQAACSSFF